MSWLIPALKTLAAVPAIWKALKELVAWLDDYFGPNWPERIEDLRKAADAWDKAKTIKERNAATREMARAFNSSK